VALPASEPLLAGDETVWPTEEDLGGQVPAYLPQRGHATVMDWNGR